MTGLNSQAFSSLESNRKRFCLVLKTGLNLASFFSKRYLFLFILVAGHFTLLASQAPKLSDTISVKNKPEPRQTQVQTLAQKELSQSVANYEQHKQQLDQRNKFTALFTEIQDVRNFLKQGFEYKKVSDLINNVTNWKEVAVEGVITNKDKIQNSRNLTATYILLNELINRVNIWERSITKYHRSLGIYQHKLDSLAKDSVLYQLSGDSASINESYRKLLAMKTRLDPLNKAIIGALDSIQRIEVQVAQLKSNLESDMAETELLRKQMDEDINFSEFEIYNQPGTKHESFSKALLYSKDKAELLATFYIANHFYKIVLMILSVIGIAIYLKLLAKRSKTANIYDRLKERTPVLVNPTATAILTTVTIFQFFLPLPPFFITSLLWLACSVSLTIILWNSVDRTWFMAWMIYFVLFVVSLFHNFILVQTPAERWAILLMNIAGIAAGTKFILGKKRKESKRKIILALLIITTAYQLLSLLFIVQGNYNFGKGYMTNGYFVMIVALMLHYTIVMSRDLLGISRIFHQITDNDRLKALLDKINAKIPFYLNAVIFLALFILISRNTYTYQAMFGPLTDAFKETRTIGKFEFTFESVFIFFLVIFLSGIISKVVSFLAADVNPEAGTTTEKGLGSWMLLVRIGIITSGVLLAFVSAGIPMDRFAVIIGALGVGIGFGMQTLANNLISGLIIAFEKPINVGDIVEISGQVGTMRSIGIRSSVVTTWDGADVIIPNGDLLSQHLINWTMGNTKRRFEISVGVAYGTDLEKTKKLLLELMLNDNRILKYPEPFVWVMAFNNSSIDFVMKFWVAHFSIGYDMRSDLILAINKLFSEHNIVIPFPQQDIHFYPSELSATFNPQKSEEKKQDNTE